MKAEMLVVQKVVQKVEMKDLPKAVTKVG